MDKRLWDKIYEARKIQQQPSTEQEQLNLSPPKVAIDSKHHLGISTRVVFVG
jgi:hypothetical protein